MVEPPPLDESDKQTVLAYAVGSAKAMHMPERLAVSVMPSPPSACNPHHNRTAAKRQLEGTSRPPAALRRADSVWDRASRYWPSVTVCTANLLKLLPSASTVTLPVVPNPVSDA